MNFSELNRRRFLATGVCAAAAGDVLSQPASSSLAWGPDANSPTRVYLADADTLAAGESIVGPARVLELKGLRGINPTSIHTAIKLVGGHTLNQPHGTLALWFFALEDLGASFVTENNMAIDNPHYKNYTFLSDHEVPRVVAPAHFHFKWNRFNELRAKFFEGTVYPGLQGFELPQKAWVQAVPFNYFDKHRWYQLAVSWDDVAKSACLYVNGILLGKSDTFNTDFKRDLVGNALYAGSPALCHGEVQFYDKVLTGADLYKKYRAKAPDYSEAEEKSLRHRFEGAALQDFTFNPVTAGWSKQFDIDFQNPVEQIKSFYVQGHTASVKPTGHPEGLLIETPNLRYGSPEAWSKQVYIWSNKTFEGDIYVEWEWKALRPNGLALMMIHASGMNREDFMADYPKKTNGTMQTVHDQNVRNYHWEFYREMNDVRNDVGTAFSRKNPFQYRIGFGSAPKPFPINAWNKAQIVQRDGQIRGAINGKVLLEINDSSRTNSGGILNYGHIGLRCMIHTAMVFRNLKVYTDKLPFKELRTVS